ncbi:hypothetical protein XH99_02095 [Bradyrhizobium nanningense]|uniref:Uncharacterized protein n=1 Tax=Bradyrhizobium nanningense TaxID=1325118 RepID=A0A4Q0SK43_9BRAD|nr:hypothetical protein XH99_02095 [Bradyrhizobium nanningense]
MNEQQIVELRLKKLTFVCSNQTAYRLTYSTSSNAMDRHDFERVGELKFNLCSFAPQSQTEV